MQLPDFELHSYPVARADEAGGVWEAVGGGDCVLDVRAREPPSRKNQPPRKVS
jgi:hypothetical protein